MLNKAKKLPASTNGFSEKQKAIFTSTVNKATEDGYEHIDAILMGISEANKHKEVKKSVVEVLADKLAVLLTSTFGLDGSSLKEIEPTVEVTKAVDVEQRRAMFVVLAPNEVDLHGDIYSEQEVEKACTNFNLHCMKANLFHRVMTNSATIEQSFITPAAFTTDDGVEVKKGTWLTWMFFPKTEEGDSLWELVKNGGITGVSIGGMAEVEVLE